LAIGCRSRCLVRVIFMLTACTGLCKSSLWRLELPMYSVSFNNSPYETPIFFRVENGNKFVDDASR
jgi:hypothetical protein